MPVNFNALRQAGPANFYEGLVQGQQEVAQNAMAQQKMAQEQQKMAQDQEMNALRVQQVRGAIGQQEREIKDQAATRKTGMFRERLMRANDPNTVRELVKMQYADPDLGPILSQAGTLEQALAEVPDDPAQFQTYRQQEVMGMSEWMKSQLPKIVGNAVYKPATDSFVTAPREPAVVAPGAPVAVIGQNGRPTYVTREQAIGMTPFNPAAVRAMGGGAGGGGAVSAPAGKPLTQLQEIKLRTDVAKDYKTATTTLSQMDDLLESIDSVKKAPGLSAATGFIGQLPSFPGGAAAQAETRLANLRGKVTALGKSLAASTGAIGSIANQEWKILADQVAALNEIKGAGPLLEQIDLVEQQTKGAIARIRDSYEKTRSEDFERFPQFRDLPASKKLGVTPAAPQGTGGFKYLGTEGSK